MAKCPIETGRPIPGGQGKRRPKISDYGTQLREKQKLRRTYGMREGQFRLFFQRASQGGGVAGENLLQMLEMRLDNIVYRLGFAPSRSAARQMVRHGHILVDGRKATIPSMIMKKGSVIEVRGKDNSKQNAQTSVEKSESRGVVSWLTLDKENLKGEVLQVPSKEEIASPVNEQLIVELYSK
jgi:small subunit ribosomal protein S4